LRTDEAFADLADRAEEFDVHLDDEQVECLRGHFRLLVKANETLNLTRVTDPEEAVVKLYLSSLAIFPALAESGVVAEGLFRYLDLGTGAGFPGIPVAVAAPHLEATLIDSRGKKAAFVEEAARTIGLTNVRALKARGGELAATHPETVRAFDLATAKAVAPAAEVLAEVKRLVRPGGYVVIHKGPGLTEQEVREGEAAARKYGFLFLGVAEPDLPGLTPRLLLYSRWSSGDEGETGL